MVGALVLLGAHGGYPAERPRLLSGAAWLASSKLGALTLLDGSSTEVAAQVQVGAPGERIDAVQDGSTAYAINRSSGSIRRVDGATFEPSAPVTPIPDARDGLLAFAGTGALFALDTERGVLANADPRTLASRGAPVSLATRVAPQAVTLDGAGRLWLLDPATGDLVWIQDGRRHLRPGVATAGAGLLSFAGGDPVVVDTQRATATVVDPRSGDTRRTIALDLRTGDRVQVSGASHAARLYLVAARGVLAICDLTAATCNTAVPMGGAGDDFGPAVETAGRVFVPDFTSGQVWVVDLHESRVVARPQVLSPRTQFQLLTRDGVVFFNDPDSEHAGVIQLDGGVRPVAKYDAKGRTGDGVVRNGTPDAGASKVPDAVPKNPPPPQPPSNPDPGSGPTPTPTSTPSTPPPVAVRIAVSNTNPLVGTDVTLQAVSDNAPGPTDAQWNFGDGQVASGRTTTHRWTTPQTFQVSVTATFPQGGRAVASVSIQVGNPRFTLTVTRPTGGTVSGGGIACPPTCTATVDSGRSLTLTTQPNAGFVLANWGGACAGRSPTCQVTMGGNRTVSATFGNTRTQTRSGSLAPGATVCAGPYYSDGTHSAHFAGQVTDGSGAKLKWTFTQSPSGQTQSLTANNFTGDFVPIAPSGLFPGFFTGCVKNTTGASVGFTEFVGPGPF